MTTSNQEPISTEVIEPASDYYPPSLLPTYHELQTLKEVADILVKSGFLPSGIKTLEAALAIMIKGWELGIPPMQAISTVRLVNGEPTFNPPPKDLKGGSNGN